MRTVRELARVVHPEAVRIAGAIRRMTISLTARALWQLVGHNLPGGQETLEAEPFLGVGFFSRPPTSGKPEAIVLMVGDAKAPVVVAVRDEKTRQAVAGALAANETAMFNDAAILVIKADGSIEARSKSGVAVKLPTLADVQKIETAIAGAVVVAADGGASLKATIVAGLASSLHGAAGTTEWPVGTTKLKAE